MTAKRSCGKIQKSGGKQECQYKSKLVSFKINKENKFIVLQIDKFLFLFVILTIGLFANALIIYLFKLLSSFCCCFQAASYIAGGVAVASYLTEDGYVWNK